MAPRCTPVLHVPIMCLQCPSDCAKQERIRVICSVVLDMDTSGWQPSYPSKHIRVSPRQSTIVVLLPLTTCNICSIGVAPRHSPDTVLLATLSGRDASSSTFHLITRVLPHTPRPHSLLLPSNHHPHISPHQCSPVICCHTHHPHTHAPWLLPSMHNLPYQSYNYFPLLYNH